MPATSTRPRGAPIERIVELWRQDLTLDQIGAEIGVTRQRVSQRLIEAGYNPAERHARTRRKAAATSQEYRDQRAQSLARRAEQRATACRQLEALADELGVKAHTLGQYAARTGTYSRPTISGKLTHAGKLPARNTSVGEELAQRVVEAAKPYSVLHIGSLCSRRA